jgi:alanyl-tRNA synthetase
MKERGHAVIPSAALVPENDPTTLFTGSGMQPLVPYLMGEVHPKGTRLTDAQKCFRAEDIDDVGDASHTTFFEMLGNWSLGDYFKREQITWIAEFYLDVVGLDPERFYVTVFAGDETAGIPRDEEAATIWQAEFEKRGLTSGIAYMGSAEEAAERGMKPGERIFYYDAKENWWSRSGVPSNMPIGEIGGGDSEMFYDFDPSDSVHDPEKFGKYSHPASDNGRFMEIGNSVFMEYIKTEHGFEKLPKQNVDFGGGLERIAAATLNSPDVYKVDVLWAVIEQLETLSHKSYSDHQEAFRVITDHIRGAVMMIGDGVLPSNTEQGYFVRRLLRRAVRYADKLDILEGEFKNLANSVLDSYEAHYTYLKDQRSAIVEAIEKEELQFRKTLEKGLREFNKLELQVHVTTKEMDGKRTIDKDSVTTKEAISAKNAFNLFTTFGFPIELTEEIAKEKGVSVDRKGFEQLMEEHRQKSRAGAEQKFKGGLADSSDQVVQYHTATHLLLAALRHFLGDHVHQAGSNITSERLRFDFTHEEKLTPETIADIENWVNQAIATGGGVTIETMPKTKAEADTTVEGSFWDRYPDEVKVYNIVGNDGTVFSRELCGGPHVENLEDIKGRFTIKKEESSSRGVRRIKAVLA